MVSWDYSVLKGAEMLEPGPKEILLVANGDRRRTANLAGQQAQLECERQLGAAFSSLGYRLRRAHPEVDPGLGHGFIETQAQGREIFSKIPAGAPLVVAEAVWQYSNHIVYNLWEHKGPILTASNFDGTWPGLVGALGLEACLTKHSFSKNQASHCLVWSSEQFQDPVALEKLKHWASSGRLEHDVSHAVLFNPRDHRKYAKAMEFGEKAAGNFLGRPRIIGLYDPLCMGMVNAAFDELDLVGLGIQLRRLNQSDLYARMLEVPRAEALGYMKWLVDRGFKLEIGSNPFTDITEKAVVQSGQMYGAIVRHVAEEGLDGVGIAYQLGLARLCAASDVVEAMLNSTERPPVEYRGRAVMPGEPIMCANEADMGCAVDQTLTKIIYRASGLEPRLWETTQHDVRWGDTFRGTCRHGGKELEIDAFIWAFELSGNTPAGHMARGWADMEAVRQPYDYFIENGICTRGLSRPGEIVWSRVYLDRGEFCLDLGRGAAVKLPPEEIQRRWEATTEEWPLMNALLYGVSRDSLMAKHKSNHITVSYAPDAETANEITLAKAAMARALGFKVFVCGSLDPEDSVEYRARKGLAVDGPHVR
ncbi:MAG: fucose isomerase [Candidatus Glassbacteria bacterium]|nr:fucose isomerase [Candidatus Glassbacteria bacterium]